MLKKEILADVSTNLITNRDDFMSSFRHNLDLYLNSPFLTTKELAEKANIPYSTLNTILYGKKIKDCKLSNVIALARALDISIDELVGAETIDNATLENIRACRTLPPNSIYLIQWYIQHFQKMNDQFGRNRKILSIMEPLCNHNGSLIMQNPYKHIDITDLDSEIRNKVFLGMRIPCEHYMPIYSPYDILLIANDRPAMPDEHVLIAFDQQLFLINRRVENGVAKLYGIRDGKYRVDEKDINEVVGYVAGVVSGMEPIQTIL